MVHTKLKPIIPSLREKKRYLVFEVISREKISNPKVVEQAILNYSQLFMGQLQAAKAGILVLSNKFDIKLQRGIIKVGHKYVDSLKSALVFANKIDGKEAIISSLGVSGILRKAENRFLNPASK